MASDTFGVLLISGTHERAHYAFSLAAGAASLGRQAVLFATNGGVRALCADWSRLQDVGRDAAVRRAGLAGLEELREAAQEIRVRLIACEAGMKAEGIGPEQLCPGVERAGIATFLQAMGSGQIVSL